MYAHCATQDLFFSKPVGILSLLDEQCSFPRADDGSFISKLNQVQKKRKWTSFIPSKDTASICFSLAHYAGKVSATVKCPHVHVIACTCDSMFSGLHFVCSFK